MVRRTCCDKQGVNRGAWSAREDKILTEYVQVHGEGKWRDLPKRAGLNRCGKSCRLRWLNYLRPDIKRGNISSDEEELIIRLHKLLGNRWSLIAGRLPGRTDNEIKNYWNTNLSKRLEMQKHSNKKAPDSGNNTPNKLRVQSLGSTKISLCVDPTESPHPVIKPKAVRCTKVMVPTQAASHSVNAMNLITTGCNSQNPSESTPQGDHDNSSAGFLRDFDISDLLVLDEPVGLYTSHYQASEINEQRGHLVGEGYLDFHANRYACVDIPKQFGDEACRLDDSIGEVGPVNWELDDFFPPDKALDFSFFPNSETQM